MLKAIKFYRPYGKYAWLSNFYVSPFEYLNKRWSTVEHAFQAQKTLCPLEAKRIQEVATPFEAKKLGRTIKLRTNWECIKNEIMFECLTAKYKINYLAKLLIDTHPCNLIENSPFDYYWGCGRNGTGLNYLGKLLVKVRGNLINEKRVANV